MTSQIVLINQMGIGIASDTLMTSGGSGGKKTTPSSNKIYEVGPDHSVVVLHNGETTIGLVGFELLIDQWSRTLEKPLSTVKDYAESFEKWFPTFEAVPLASSWIIHSYFCDLWQLFAKLLDSDVHMELLRADDLDKDLEQQFIDAINEFAQDVVLQRDIIPGISSVQSKKSIDDASEDVVEHCIAHIQSFFNDDFTVDWSPTPKMQEAITNVALQALMHTRASGRIAELNFVGYGTNDVLGSHVRQIIYSAYAEKLNTTTYVEYPLTGGEGLANRSWYATLGQDEAMEAFIQGVSETTLESIEYLANQALYENSEDVDEDIVSSFMESVNDHLMNKFTLPFVSTVAGLSVRGLVRFAEAMLEIESLRAASGSGTGTVGGEIDSLLITKRDGINWCYRMINDLDGEGHSPHPFL